MRKLVAARRLSQTFFLGLFIYVLWSTIHPLKNFLSVHAFFVIDPNIMWFTSVSERQFIPSVSLSFVFVLLTLALGRFFCGWICPMGSMIDLAGNLNRRKTGLSPRATKIIRSVKFFVLVVIFAFALTGIQVAWTMDPIVLAARFVSLNLIPTVTLVVDRSFTGIITSFNLYGAVYDLYRVLKSSIPGGEARYFVNSLPVLMFFLVVCLSSIALKRAWCRGSCPLGAIYALFARFSVFRRTLSGCVSCGICSGKCRMGAIRKEGDYEKMECVMCMDCVYDCPKKAARFVFPCPDAGKITAINASQRKGISRKDFLFLIISSILAIGMKGAEKRGEALIRPPGASREKRFVTRCVRCGNCMKVCPTNGLQPAMFQAGLEGIWTPYLSPEIGYCEYNCALCGEVCPTGAIPKLPIEIKRKTKLGLAIVDKKRCLAWGYDTECLVCEEHCPVPDKAIKISNASVSERVIGRPVVDEKLCIGCCICQTKCPARPVRAIRVNGIGEENDAINA